MHKFTITTEYRIDYPEDTGACSERAFAGEFEPIEHSFYALYALTTEGAFVYGASDYREDLEEVAREYMHAPSLKTARWIPISEEDYLHAVSA